MRIVETLGNSSEGTGVIGTPHYLAPEVFVPVLQSEEAGEDGSGDGRGGGRGDGSAGDGSGGIRSMLEQLKLVDAYSAGAVLHETCALCKPFDGPTLQVLLEAIVEGKPAHPIPACFTSIDDSLRGLAAKMMAREPGRRLGVAEAMSVPSVQRELDRLEAMGRDMLATAGADGHSGSGVEAALI
jgi:serine/threonine protein kinase